MPLSTLLARLRQLWTHDIWAAGLIRDRTWKGRGFAFLRILSITASGLNEMHVAIRAAALSYSSLLALGPLVAIAVLISGFALDERDPAATAQAINKVISFIAPQVAEYDRAEQEKPEDIQSGAVAQTDHGAETAPKMVQLINDFIAGSRTGSGIAGLVGVMTLFIIVIGLFTTIENTFNDIWGVHRGRSWAARIIYYWSVITLGAVLFFASFTLLASSAAVLSFIDRIPLGAGLKDLIFWMLPSSSVLILVLLLTLFYRFVPHTRVRWTAALIGAVLVTALLFLNNYLAFLYFKRVALSKSLYGSVSIMPILMIGLYIFWFFVLVGGQITYAVQNVRYRSSQTAWHSLNHATRESMSLVVLLLIARRFKAAGPAYSVSHLAGLIRVPSQILNESLNRLCAMRFVTELPPADSADPNDHRYQPARPLDQITLDEFRREFENYGEAPTAGLLENVDPVLALYHQRVAQALPTALGQQTLNELIDELQPSHTYAPFAVKPPS